MKIHFRFRGTKPGFYGSPPLRVEGCVSLPELTFDLSVLPVRHCGGKLTVTQALSGCNLEEQLGLKEK